MGQDLCKRGASYIMKINLRAARVLVLFLTLFGGLVLLTYPSLAQERYFPEVGYVVEGEFLRFFNQHGGLRVFGFPISPAFRDNAQDVQYFQKGRLELGPDGRADLSPLPEEFSIKATEPIGQDQVSAGGMYFPATGHSVVMAFLDFYLQYGGPDLLGYPITELVNENDRLVQYFERGILEWWPELPNGQRVQLSSLGESYFQLAQHDPTLLYARIAPSDKSITSIHASVSVQSPMVGLGEAQQTIYVSVRDQLGEPVQGAEVKAFVLWPIVSQRILVTPAQVTNENGIASFPFGVNGLSAFGPLAPGDTVPVQVEASFDNHQSGTATAFRIWW